VNNIVPRISTLVKSLHELKSVKVTLRLIESCNYLDPAVWDKQGGNKRILESLKSGTPQAIGKLGSNELQALRNYLRYRHQADWEQRVSVYQNILYTHAGVFPDDPDIFRQYCDYMLEEILPEVTILAVWFNIQEARIVKRYAAKAVHVPIESLDTYLSTHDRWTSNLKSKTVLVMHPFVNSIRLQYKKRLKIWNGQEDILPEFNLVQIKVPPHPSLVGPSHPNWFDSLEDMKQQMTEMDFDVALIGAGAYSLPLAVHAKKLGKQGIHLGGGTQIYFGIKGKRWDNQPTFRKFFNDAWIRPLPEDTPENCLSVENGSYW
jgi:hypothetical protein